MDAKEIPEKNIRHRKHCGYSPRHLRRMIKKGVELAKRVSSAPSQQHISAVTGASTSNDKSTTPLITDDQSSPYQIRETQTFYTKNVVLPQHFNANTELTKETETANFMKHLSAWAVDNKIGQTAFSKLLQILRTDLNLQYLPIDSRTMLKTDMKKFKIIPMNPGLYYHFSLESAIINICKMGHVPCVSDFVLLLQINIDGLPLAKSSGSQFWPILGFFENIRNCDPFPIGIFHGHTKPSDPNVFMKYFVEEYVELCKRGVKYEENVIKVQLTKILCDAPAKAFILYVKNHNAYHGCTKCTTEGDFIGNRLTYPDMNAVLRTDDSFKNMLDEEFHKDITLLLKLNIGLVSDVPLDYMHLICLGVTKRLLLFWVKGNQRVRLFKEQVMSINSKIMQYKKCSVLEFSRKPRGLDEIDRWKATELRQFLLYYGPIVMKGYLSKHLYTHFLTLHCAIRILASPELCFKYNSYAHALLKFFIENYGELYGSEYINHNIHNLIHISADVLKHGPLDNFSCFKFENFMHSIKMKLRTSKYPLQQFINRYYEGQKYSMVTNIGKSGEVLKDMGPKKINDKLVLTYAGISFENMQIRIQEPNCFAFLKNKLPVKVYSIFKENNEVYIEYSKFINFYPYFNQPCPSTKFSCGFAKRLSSNLEIAHVSEILYKAIKIDDLFITLVHKN